MRETIFQAWDKKRKIMFQVMRINFDYQFPGSIGAVYPYPYDNFWRPEDGEARNWYYSNMSGDGGRQEVIEDLVLREYTSLHDKNGKKVFEGDIVKYKKWNQTSSKLKAVAWVMAKQYCGWNLASANNYEVIGNIHQNPELLKAA